MVVLYHPFIETYLLCQVNERLIYYYFQLISRNYRHELAGKDVRMFDGMADLRRRKRHGPICSIFVLRLLI